MIWQYFTKSRRQTTPRSSFRLPYRPKLDMLEDRTLLTVTTFMLNPNASSLSLLGSTFTASGFTVPINEQGDGSLTATQSGTITADIDLDAGTINFLNDGTAI